MIINKTPHAIVILRENGEVLKTVEPSLPPARLAMSEEVGISIDGIPTVRTVFGECENLPDQQENVWIIVSQIIKSANHHRKDLVVPARVQRDTDGKIIGCQALGV